MLKVYFAGPVTENLWRNQIFGFNPLVLEDNPPIIDSFKYAGPYVRHDWDDSLKHYEACYAYEDEVDFDDPESIENTTVFIESQSTVFKRSLCNIDDCDVVFAYIESVYNTGTLAEIMHAYSKKKYIIACVNTRIEDEEIWFPLQAIDEIIDYNESFDNLKGVWDYFVNNNPFKDHYKVTGPQEYTIKKYYENSNFTVVPDLINKYDAIKLINSIKNEKYEIEEIQNKLIQKGALRLQGRSGM